MGKRNSSKAHPGCSERGKGNDESGMIKDMQAKIGQLTMENDFLSAPGRVASTSAKK